MEKDNVWTTYNEEDLKELESLCDEYKVFLDHGKTERECVIQAVAMAEEKGYQDLDTVIKEGKTLNPGDRVYAVGMKKCIVLFMMFLVVMHAGAQEQKSPVFIEDGFSTRNHQGQV